MLAAIPQRDAPLFPGLGNLRAPTPSPATFAQSAAGGGGLLPLELPAGARWGWTPEPPSVLPTPPALMALLGDGVPRGKLCEIFGPLGTGRTSLLYSLLAQATVAREVAAVVDLPNAFDPISAARAAIDLDAVLWVRPASVHDGLRCTEQILGAGGFGLVILDLDGCSLRRVWAHTWPRLARAAGRSATALFVLASRRVSGSFATFSLTLTRTVPVWRTDGPRLFEGLDVRVCLARNKLGAPRKTLDFELRNADCGMRNANFQKADREVEDQTMEDQRSILPNP